MTDNPLVLFVAAFDNEGQAEAELRDFQAMNREGSIELIDVAAIVREAEGKIKFVDTAESGGKKWAKRGAIAGGVVGLIFPPSIIIGAAVGAAGGGIWGKVRDKGILEEKLKAIGESLQPGTSAIIVIAEDPAIERLEKELEGHRVVARDEVSAEAAAAITAELKDESPN